MKFRITKSFDSNLKSSKDGNDSMKKITLQELKVLSNQLQQKSIVIGFKTVLLSKGSIVSGAIPTIISEFVLFFTAAPRTATS